jgi:hypothetical protein
LLKEGKAAAESWGKADETKAIAERETAFVALVAATQVEQWQINPAVHYNQWANFHRRDFLPVVESFKRLLAAFACSNATCGGLLYVVPERERREALRCACNATNINLQKKRAVDRVPMAQVAHICRMVAHAADGFARLILQQD